ncbi:ATP-grasp domain-containing protein [Vibrio campbellii]|uniref:ATP-grasp domain-containing protein n=1 Tax=Vibrio campbellii TaxID=680 RepID=UPI001E4AC0A9|nr:ATP-grasp domain-containing protein [Vibrio campbellii]MCC8252543.1 ATP-grasp domain-containing protein [Vibrio campbellii CAIM 333]
MEYIILGGAQPVLPILRGLARQGKTVHTICKEREIASRSKYGKKHILAESKDSVSIVKEIVSSTNSKVTCILGSESYVKLVGALNEIKGLTVFAMDERSILKLSDKVKLYKHAESLGLETLPANYLNEKHFENKLFPGIVKWSSNDDCEHISKTTVVNTSIELLDLKNKIEERYHEKMVVQKLLSNYKSYSFGSIWKNGELVDFCVVRQMRQYPLGITSSVSYISGVIEENIKRRAMLLLKDFNPNGFIEIEFIENRTKFYVIDVNPRVWGWSPALTSKFAHSWGRLFNQEGEKIEPPRNIYYRWVNVLRDIPAIIKSDLSTKEKVLEVMKYFKKSTMLQSIDLLDPRPELSGILK